MKPDPRDELAVTEARRWMAANGGIAEYQAFLYPGVGVEITRGGEVVQAFPIEPITGPDDPRLPVPGIEILPDDEDELYGH